MNRPNSAAPSPSRRRFLRRSLLGGAGVFGAGMTYQAFSERHSLRVYRVTVALSHLPAALEGFTICQLSDLHRGILVSEEFLRRAAILATSLRPDLTVVTGDFLDLHARYAPSCASALSALQARYGVFGVLGNHDYWTKDPDRVSETLAGAGVRMLTNRSARILVPGADWWLCGVDDPWGGEPDLDAALQDVPQDAFKILLCHAPDFVEKAARRGIPLQLSGHTHGGQVLLPGRHPLVTPKYGHRYPVGLQRVTGTSTQVYTNVGVGVIFPPIRINCPPEVTLMTLTRTRQTA